MTTPLGLRRWGAVACTVALVISAGCGTRLSRHNELAANGLLGGTNEGSGIAAGSNGDIGSTGASSSGSAPGAVGQTSNSAGTGGPSGSVPAASGQAAVGAGQGAAAVTGGGCATPGDTSPLVVGSVGNYSGPAGPPQAPMARAVQVWAQYINSKGGVCGHKVQVILEDDGSDPARYSAEVQDLVQNRHVVAFVENAAAQTINSGDQYLRSVGVPVIGTECAAIIEYQSPVIFPQCESFFAEFYSDVRTGVQYGGGTKLAFLYCAEAQTCADGKRAVVDQGAASQAGAQVVYTAQVSLTQIDFTSECRAAQQAGAQLMFVLEDPTGVIRAAQSCARQGYYPTYVQGSATVFYNTKDQPGFNKLVVGMPTFSFVGATNPNEAEFQQVMKGFYGQAPGPAEAIGWTAAKEFELAATRAAQTAKSINSKTIIDALRAFHDETIGGLATPLSFSSGHADPALCWWPVEVTGGNWTALNGGQMQCR